MIASLPMYARPHNRAAHDALWNLIRDALRDHGVAAPDALCHDIGHDAIWSRPDMVLGHICNLPYRAAFRGKITLIGAGDYGLPETPPGYYHSVFVVRQDDPAQSLGECVDHRLAINDPLSQSGWGVLWMDTVAQGLAMTPTRVTGAHRASVAAVATGDADLACIDAQSWQMDADTPEARTLRVIGRSTATPGLTFVTAGTVDPAPYFTAIAQAIAALPQTHSATLGLRGIVALPKTAYDLPIPPQAADRATSAA